MGGTTEEKRAREPQRPSNDDDLWSRVNAAPVSAFLAVAEAERCRNGVAPPLIREGRDSRACQAGRGGAAGGKGKGRMQVPRLERLDVDAFVAHLTTGPDSLGGKGQCEHRLDVPARPTRLAPGVPRPPRFRPATVAALVASGVPLDDADHARACGSSRTSTRG